MTLIFTRFFLFFLTSSTVCHYYLKSKQTNSQICPKYYSKNSQNKSLCSGLTVKKLKCKHRAYSLPTGVPEFVILCFALLSKNLENPAFFRIDFSQYLYDLKCSLNRCIRGRQNQKNLIENQSDYDQ